MVEISILERVLVVRPGRLGRVADMVVNHVNVFYHHVTHITMWLTSNHQNAFNNGYLHHNAIILDDLMLAS